MFHFLSTDADADEPMARTGPIFQSSLQQQDSESDDELRPIRTSFGGLATSSGAGPSCKSPSTVFDSFILEEQLPLC